MKNTTTCFLIFAMGLMAGCASVPLASQEEDAMCKSFEAPTDGNAGVYIYRNCFAAQAIKRAITLDDERIGETANCVYFYKVIPPGSHTLSTQSEFGENTINFNANPGCNYFFEQYMTMGVFAAGSDIKAVSDTEGKANVMKCNLAK